MSESYHDVCRDSELTVGHALAKIIKGWPVLVCRSEQGFHAVINRCTHAASPLTDGRVRRSSITCPLHGARFDLVTGKCLGLPYLPLKVFPVRVVEGRLEVAVPDEEPDVQQLPVRAQASS